jgi:hypothetical protein
LVVVVFHRPTSVTGNAAIVVGAARRCRSGRVKFDASTVMQLGVATRTRSVGSCAPHGLEASTPGPEVHRRPGLDGFLLQLA